MKSTLTAIVLFVANGLFCTTASATILEISPNASIVNVGDSLSVDINISGLADGAAPSLGAFLVEIMFAEAILNFNNVTYNSYLGDTDPLAFETDIISTSAAGLVSLDEFSFLFDFELDALQPAAFTLATLTFDVVGAGINHFAFGFIDISTAFGEVLEPDLISTQVSAVAVPEPSSLLLLLLGLPFLFRKQSSYPLCKAKLR